MVHVQLAPPTRIRIPTIGVDAEVGEVVTTQGEDNRPHLTPPEATLADLQRAYWWSEKQAPGNPAPGTTFILGHSCHLENCPSVYNRLQDVAEGNLIVVETANGILTYKVFDINKYPIGITPNTVTDDHPNRLVLVTCELPAQERNVIVTARLVDVQKK
jgi:sortase (surface protein transpeptidase)